MKRYNIPDISNYTSLSIIVSNWVKEKTLNSMLLNDYYDTSKKVDTFIETIQTTISYGLPMLLAPFYDIINPDCGFLQFIEMGAYNQITRRLIELNVPRETAIYLYNNYLKKNEKNIQTDKQLLSELKNTYNKLCYWEKIQIEHLI